MGDQDLELFRKERDEFFRTDPHSPLTPEQRPAFRGLAYYPEEPELRIEGRLDPPPEEGEVRMPTSTGGEQVYRRAGVVRLSVEGRAAEITLYAASGDHELFLPFRDATSGQETYPAGRYLAVERPTGGRVVIDFNHAYNPYCAYNERWSCPLPPPENWLEVPIRAGERDFPLRAH